MRGTKTKVSVIIPTLNREKILVDTINSVIKQEFKHFELIVVDQSIKHRKKTQRFLDNLYKLGVHYYQITPPSLPGARNYGLSIASGEVIIYIDDDVSLDPGFIKSHWNSYKNQDIVAVVGRIREKLKPPSNTLMYFRKTGFGAGNFNYPNQEYAETLQGCNMSFNKKILANIGGFDTNYIGNAIREESDVSFKLTKLGYKILYNPKASLYHKVYPSGGCREDNPTFDNYIQYRNEFLFFLRHRPKKFLPYFLGGHFYRYVFNRDMINKRKVLFRLRMFIKGIIIGTYIYFFPRKQIVSQKIILDR